MSFAPSVLTLDAARGLAATALVRGGASPENAASVARALVAVEADGQVGHGLSRVPSYVAQLTSGKVDGKAVPSIARVAPAALRIDAGHGFAYPAIDSVVEMLPPLVRENGIALAAIARSHHFGQAGAHCERLARQGLVAFVFGNTPKAMALWGGTKPVLGTNPIAIDAVRISGGAFANRMTALAAVFDHEPGTRLPGSRRLMLREKAEREGLMLPPALLVEIRALAGEP